MLIFLYVFSVNHGAKIRIFSDTNFLYFKRQRVDIRVYLVVEGVGGHAEEVGDRVVHVGAEGVDGVADAEVVELGDAEGAFSSSLAVVEVADEAATAPADIIQSRVLANDPQHLVPTRSIEGILFHLEELRVVIIVAVDESGFKFKGLTLEGEDCGHLILQHAVALVQLLGQRQQPLVDYLEASHLGLGGMLCKHLIEHTLPCAEVVVNYLLCRLVPIALEGLGNTQDIILTILQPLAQLADIVFLFLHFLIIFSAAKIAKRCVTS